MSLKPAKQPSGGQIQNTHKRLFLVSTTPRIESESYLPVRSHCDSIALPIWRMISTKGGARGSVEQAYRTFRDAGHDQVASAGRVRYEVRAADGT